MLQLASQKIMKWGTQLFGSTFAMNSEIKLLDSLILVPSDRPMNHLRPTTFNTVSFHGRFNTKNIDKSRAWFDIDKISF